MKDIDTRTWMSVAFVVVSLETAASLCAIEPDFTQGVDPIRHIIGVLCLILCLLAIPISIPRIYILNQIGLWLHVEIITMGSPFGTLTKVILCFISDLFICLLYFLIFETFFYFKTYFTKVSIDEK